MILQVTLQYLSKVSKIVYVNNQPFFYFSEAKHGLEALKTLFYNHVRDIDQSLAEQQ